MKQISTTNVRFALSLSQSRTSPSNVDTIFVGNVVIAYSVSVKQSVPRVVNQTHSRALYSIRMYNEKSEVSKYAVLTRSASGLVN